MENQKKDIVEDLMSVVQQIIAQERSARDALVKTSHIQLEDRVFRSYGILSNARIIEQRKQLPVSPMLD